MKRKVVVLGGSFNPPTIAHEKLLVTGVNTVQADIGLYVPSSHNYVARKMAKKRLEKQTLPEGIRYDMLAEMCKVDSRLKVDTCEYGDDGRGHTYDTLVKIQNKYPDADVYFIVGYDTIRMIPRWHSKNDLVANFRFIVFSRNGLDAAAEVNRYELLKKYSSHFVLADTPNDIQDISSTLVREQLHKGNTKLGHLVDKNALKVLLNNTSYFK